MNASNGLAVLIAVMFSTGCLTREVNHRSVAELRKTVIEPEVLDSTGRTADKIRLIFHAGSQRDFLRSHVSRVGEEVVVSDGVDEDREHVSSIPTAYINRIELFRLVSGEPAGREFNPAAAIWIVPVLLAISYGILCAAECGGH